MANIADFGAVGDGITNNDAALTSALVQASSTGEALYIPVGVYRYTQDLILTKPIPVFGDSRSTSTLLYDGTDHGLKIVPAVSCAGHTMRDFAIVPTSQNLGTYGIEVTIGAGISYSYFNWSRLFVGTAERGFSQGVWLNNLADAPGFYNGQFDCVYIENGLVGDRLGDNIVFNNCIIHGHHRVSISGRRDKGARQVVFNGGQITTRGGFLQAYNMMGLRLMEVECEHPSNLGRFEGPGDSGILINQCYDTHIARGSSHVDPTSGTPQISQNIALIGCDLTKIYDVVFVNRGSAAHIYGNSTTTRTAITNREPTNLTIVLQGS